MAKASTRTDTTSTEGGKKMKVVRVTARRDGFRRAGIAHSTKPTDHPAESLTEAQLAALKAEPMLTVQELEVEAPDKAEGPATE